MSSRSFDLSEARAKRVAQRIIDKGMPTLYKDVVDSMAEEDVHRPGSQVEKLIGMLYAIGFEGLANSIGQSCAYQVKRLTEERENLVRGIAPFVEEIVESMQEEL
jgi:hypothetical protein